jgi:ATP-dependent RNA helicase RhlE
LKTFKELDLIAPVQRALADEQYEIPTPIQAQTIPAALLGRDVLGCAQTGTGKTAAFALPILHREGEQNRRAKPNRPYVLVLAPTRELAIQIGESFETYGRHLKLRHALVYGGVSQVGQVRALNQGAHILVATPGRLLDLMNQGHIVLSELDVFVLDEADQMLNMGFLPDLKRIISKLPQKRQSLFFSATLPLAITELSQRLLRNPISVNVTPKSTSLTTIEQRVMFVERHGKQALLKKILSAADVERAIVFTRTKRGANVLAEKLMQCGIKADAIHGNKSQNARQRALEAFRNQKITVLVATDVAARGIDIDGVTHVVNYDLPVEPECYVHRIGRTGRAGAEGIALTFCSASEIQELQAIERLIGKRIKQSGSDQDRPEPTRSDRFANERPQAGTRSRRPSRRPQRQRSQTQRGPTAKATANHRSKAAPSGSQSPAKRETANASGDQQRPKQKRRRRNPQHSWQQVR